MWTPRPWWSRFAPPAPSCNKYQCHPPWGGIFLCGKFRFIALLSRCIVGGGALDAPRIKLSGAGQTVRKYIESGNRIPEITVDKFVIMPNHIHLILLVDNTSSSGMSRAPSSANVIIPHFVSTLKRFCHRDIGHPIFQRSYYDHIIRNEQDYLKIWEYIDSNPEKWQEDCFYVPPQL